MIRRNDVPSPIDFRNMADAREWESTAMVRRPVRTDFFRRMCEELESRGALDVVLELGSGPGFLARYLLSRLPIRSYVALDFSAVMHALARERLGEDLSPRVTFIEADFKRPAWTNGLGQCDAVVTLQAVHELRHKRHAPTFYREVHQLLRDRDAFLVCDHFVGEGAMTDTALYMTLEEHEGALWEGGFTNVEVLLQKGGLVLLRAQC